MNLNTKTKEELKKQLAKEMLFYNEDIYDLAKIICNELPRSMIYRIISKLYRIRTGGK